MKNYQFNIYFQKYKKKCFLHITVSSTITLNNQDLSKSLAIILCKMNHNYY